MSAASPSNMPQSSREEQGWVELVAHLPLFRHLPASVREDVLRRAQRRKFDDGTFLFQQGELARVVYILISGRVKLLQVTLEGHEVLLRVMGPGEMVGGIAALIGGDYPASAQAVGPCEVLVWHRDEMLQLMEQHGRLALNALQFLAERFHELQDRYRELATERVERRVARALLRLARQVGRKEEGRIVIDFPLSRQDLAEMTGTTLYTVSRILRQWEQQGLIETQRVRVHILSPHGLVRIAEDLPPE